MVEHKTIFHTSYESKKAMFDILPVIKTKSPSPLVEALDSILEHFFNYFQPQEGQLIYYGIMLLFIILHYFFSPVYGGVPLYLLIVFTMAYIFILPTKVILQLLYRLIKLLLKYLKKIIFKILLKIF